MNRTILILGLLLAAVWYSPAQAQDANKATATVTPNPLEVRGDSVRLKAKIIIPAHRKLKDGGTLTIIPRLGDYKYDKFTATYGPLTNVRKNGINADVSITLPFITDMIGKDIDFTYVYDAGGDRIAGEVDDVAQCCSTVGLWFINNAQYQFATVDTVRTRDTQPLKLLAQFNFPVDISKLSKDAYQRDVKAIGDFLKKNPESTITIRGFASPEGTMKRNVQLSQERSKQAADWLQAKLKEMGYSGSLGKATFKTETTAEDWRGFKETLMASDYPDATKQKVIDAINAGKPAAETEKNVMALLGGKSKRVEELLQPLRRSIVVVETNKAMRPALNDKQLDSVAVAYISGNMEKYQLREILDKEEWLEAAQRTKAPSGKMSLLLAYYDVYREDYRAINDLAILKLVREPDAPASDGIAIVGGDDAIVGVGGDFDSKFKNDIKKEPQDVNAYKYKYKIKYDNPQETVVDFKYKGAFTESINLLELAYQLNRNDWAVLSNLGAAYMVVENYPKAIQYLTQSLAQKNSPQAHYNLGLAYAQTGQFAESIRHFDQAGNLQGVYYNRGLAKLLGGDSAGAKADLLRHTQLLPDHAMGYYALAIAGARSGDINTISENLPKAIQRKKVLSDIAQEDLEFRNFHSVDAFKKAADDDKSK
ncbi:tetratricopeptide repeat protein [Nibribacter ruber]|uniref:Tetratricopeptide repeat protein n=1 Tax=Nibribacter ruber TaxID=2698458 RepID=A0A6P1P2I5_9BACT|nr:tetratricopeptide repeat protein [Nibribacter ruber]QHL88601.1 tetratricopeptide repeat protein [Nibribacter ruber]